MKNHEKPTWNHEKPAWVVTGDSQEEVLIFRYTHCIIIYISPSSSSQSSFDRRGSQWHHECFMQNGGGAGTSCRQFLIIMIFVIINISIGIIIVVITSSSSSSSSSWDIVIIIVITIVISLFRCNHHHQPTCHYHLNNCKLSYFLVSCCDYQRF